MYYRRYWKRRWRPRYNRFRRGRYTRYLRGGPRYRYWVSNAAPVTPFKPTGPGTGGKRTSRRRKTYARSDQEEVLQPSAYRRTLDYFQNPDLKRKAKDALETVGETLGIDELYRNFRNEIATGLSEAAAGALIP